ncbi:MAG TPA: hypothetical protein VK400_12135 [Pyrinomonadaceae bacterium]|nr:hypothetical protein [Pyrinomonadaceae bacterium]
MKTAALLRRILPPLWCGMVCATAMEAQLKFQAPGITRELGLGIGKLVFTALNRVECVLAILLAIALFAFAPAGGAQRRAKIVFGALAVVLLAQTFWLIPLLIERIDLITSGRTPPDSAAHFVYIALEIAKILLLLTLSVLLNLQSENYKNETRH